MYDSKMKSDYLWHQIQAVRPRDFVPSIRWMGDLDKSWLNQRSSKPTYELMLTK